MNLNQLIMKKQYFLFISALFFCVLLLGQNKITTPYDFPLKPGMAEWEKLNSGKEMLDACQIPEEILKNMTSQALAETCINYPLYIDYLAANDERVGIYLIINNFNGLKELSERADGYKELINVYKKIPILDSNAKAKQEDSPFQIIFVELILGDNAFMNKMNADDLIYLKAAVLEKYQNKVDNDEVYSLYNTLRTLLLGAEVMAKQGSISAKTRSMDNDVSNFIKNYTNPTKEELEKFTKILCE